jgi:hypothetical protein
MQILKITTKELATYHVTTRCHNPEDSELKQLASRYLLEKQDNFLKS